MGGRSGLTNNEFGVCWQLSCSAPQRTLTRDQLLELSRLPNAEVHERSIDDPSCSCVARSRSTLSIHSTQDRAGRWLFVRGFSGGGTIVAAPVFSSREATNSQQGVIHVQDSRQADSRRDAH